jgi:hypothetical protein
LQPCPDQPKCQAAHVHCSDPATWPWIINGPVMVDCTTGHKQVRTCLYKSWRQECTYTLRRLYQQSVNENTSMLAIVLRMHNTGNAQPWSDKTK